MRSPICIILCSLLLSSCQFSTDGSKPFSLSQSKRGVVSNAGFNSNAVVQKNGVAIEQRLFDGKYLNQYNNDNLIYRPGRVWNYKLSAAQNNQLKAFEINARGEWRLVPKNSRSSRNWQRVDELVMEVVDGYGPYESSFDQTVVKYSYRFEGGRTDGNESFTGLVENDANVWLHPLRQDFFEILALNPYPFVQLPLEVGKRFHFNLPVHENWSNPEWKKWYGTLANNCRYEVVKQRSIELPFGELSPYAIMSNCENELGDTGLVAYFDEGIGFVKLDYRNIDGSWLTLELLERP